MNFSELQLENSLNQAIEKLGYSEQTPIQSMAIPHILDGKDISGLAQTGTGKTAAFLVPLMERILRSRTATEGQEHGKRAFAEWKAQNFILILVPTRELAEQVYENIVQLSEFSGLRGVSIYGGTSYDKQKEAIRNQVEFVVATPGRLIDLYKENIIDLKQVKAIVFDEADRMFDMGFKDDMKYILQRVPRERQFLVFSATLNFDVLNTAYQFGAEPIEINISRDQAKAENVKDEIFHLGQEDKPQYLLSLIRKYNPKQLIVFSNFKYNVEKIAHFLNSNGVPAMAISSLLTQSQRNRVIEQFKADNEKNILVATDVAARGLDIKGVDLVINYELPNDAESYVHRIGRTGRAGMQGLAFSLVSDRDVESLGRIEDYLKNKVAIGWLDETELVKEMKPFPRDDHFDRAERPQRKESFGDRKNRPHQRDGSRNHPKKHHQGGRGGPIHKQGRSADDQRSNQNDDRRNQGGHQTSHQGGGQGYQGRRHSQQGSGQHQKRGHERHFDKKNQNENKNRQHSSKNRWNDKSKPFQNKSKNYQASKSNQPQTVTQKITGFFKKLFS